MQYSNNIKIVFIVGNSRSGTTLLGRILNNNPLIYTFNEIHFYEKLYDPTKAENSKLEFSQRRELFANLMRIQRDGYLSRVKNSDSYSNEITNELLRDNMKPEDIYLKFLSYETNINGKSIACEQTPRNLYYIDNILKLPADISIINLIRDPRDVVLSQKKKWRRKFLGASKIPYLESIRSLINYHPITMALLWRSSINQINEFKNRKGVHIVKFEELILKPESELKKITKILNVDYSKDMLNVHQAGSSEVQDKSKIGINKSRVNPWRVSNAINKTEIYICEKICTDQMKEYGYTLSGARPSLIVLLYLYITFPLKTIASLLFNIKRYKNINTSLFTRVKNII